MLVVLLYINSTILDPYGDHHCLMFHLPTRSGMYVLMCVVCCCCCRCDVLCVLACCCGTPLPPPSLQELETAGREACYLLLFSPLHTPALGIGLLVSWAVLLWLPAVITLP